MNENTQASLSLSLSLSFSLKDKQYSRSGVLQEIICVENKRGNEMDSCGVDSRKSWNI